MPSVVAAQCRTCKTIFTTDKPWKTAQECEAAPDVKTLYPVGIVFIDPAGDELEVVKAKKRSYKR